MDNNAISFEELDANEKRIRQKNKRRMRTAKFLNWISEYPFVIICVVPTVVGGILAVANTMTTMKISELYCYDSSLGHYWALRRKLSNSDWTTISERKQNGEALGTILKDLNVLK